MMKTPVDAGDTLRVGTAEALFDTGIRRDAGSGPRHMTYRRTRSGFYCEGVNIGRELPLTVVLNWQKLVR